MIIDYIKHGKIQIEGEDPQEALKWMNLPQLDIQGQLDRVEFFIDGKNIMTWHFIYHLPSKDLPF
jgi:hypothetical protein